MSTDTRAQLAELRRLSMSDLKQRWRDLIGTKPPQYSRSFLVSRLAYRLQELTYGGLSPTALADMDVAVHEVCHAFPPGGTFESPTQRIRKAGVDSQRRVFPLLEPFSLKAGRFSTATR